MLDSFQGSIDELPKICIYCPDTDCYSQFYETDDNCQCGNCEWLNSALVVNVFESRIATAPKRFQKCASCSEVRVSRLKKEFETIIKLSSSCLETLLRTINSHHDCLYVIKNMLHNLEKKILDERCEKNKVKTSSMKKFCDESNIDKTVILDMVKKMSDERASKYA